VILRDPVHGLISFEGATEEIVVRLLDTAEVQRLRRIRCLGPASLAFPGAEHSRFAHAVGAAFVMKRYLESVRTLSDDIPAADRVDDDTARIALAAALLHDLASPRSRICPTRCRARSTSTAATTCFATRT
jgi:HD superfamily phosphohydrolase